MSVSIREVADAHNCRLTRQPEKKQVAGSSPSRERCENGESKECLPGDLIDGAPYLYSIYQALYIINAVCTKLPDSNR